VTVKANDRTGLSRPDTFAFGNLRGDTGDGAGPPRVDAADLARTRAGASSPFDHNRDGLVDALDLAIVRRALFNSLTPVEWPPPPAAQSLHPLGRRAALARRGGVRRAVTGPGARPAKNFRRPARRSGGAAELSATSNNRARWGGGDPAPTGPFSCVGHTRRPRRRVRRP
jgi:hypothetical protein